MAEVAANLLVKVGADISDAQRKLGAVSDSLQNFGRSAMRTGGLMTAGITTPLVAAGLALTNYASDLDETRSKAVTVFGDQAAALEEWAATSSQTFGLSTQAALDYTGSLGNMMIQLGATSGEALTFSQEMVGAAADLASFHNAAGGSAEVLDTMAAAFRGEYDALQRYIPTINAAAVEQQALAMTGKESAKELTAMEKAMAAQQIILDNMGPALGDFARTSDGLANSQRTLKAEVENVMATLGQQLLPIVQQVVGVISQAVQWFSNLDPTIQTVIVAVAGLAAAAGPVVMAIGAIATAVGALASPIGIVIAAIAALAAAWVTDFGGIRTTVTQFWEQHLQPIFETLVQWLQDNIPVALAALAGFWENTLKPAIEVVWQFLQANVFPILETLVNVYFAALKVELQALALLWTNVLKPAIEAVWQFITTYVVPLIEALVNVNLAALKLAIEVLAGIWRNVLKPAIEAVWQFITNNVVPALVSMKAVMDGPLGTALRTIAGLFGRVAEAVGGIGSAVQGVIDWLNRLASTIGGIRLPGWLGGDGRGMAGAGGAVAGAETMARDAQTIANALKALVEAFAVVAQYEGVKIGPQLNVLFGQLHGVVYKLQKVAQLFSDKGLGYAVALAEAGGKIGAALVRLVEGLDAVASYAPAKIGPTLNVLFGQLHGVVYKLQKVAQEFSDKGLDAAVTFAAAAEAVLKMVKTAVEVFERLRNYSTPGIEAINRFQRDMQYALERWVRWVTLTLQPLADDLSEEMAGTIEATVTALGAALEVLTGLVDYVSPADDAISAFIDDLGGLFRRFVQWVTNREAFGPAALLDIPPELWAILTDAMTAIGSALETLTALTDYVGPTDEAIGNFIADLGSLFRLFIQWVMERTWGSPSTLLDIPPELIRIFGEVMTGLGSAVDTLTALTDYVGPSETAIQEFTDDYTLLFEGFAQWAEVTFVGVTFDATAAVATVFDDVMSGLSSAVGTLTALVNYAGPSEASILEFEADYQRLFSGFITWAQTILAVRGLAAVGAIGEALGAVFAGLGAAVTTLLGIVGYIGPSETAIQEFEADYQRLFDDFVTWAQGALTVDGAALVQAIGDAIGSVFAGLGAAAATLQSIVGYVGPTDEAIAAFIGDVEDVIIALRDFAQGSFTTESLAFLSAFSDAIDGLFTAMGTALDTLSGIADYTTSDSDFVLALQRFNQNLYTAIHSWNTWIVDIMDPETTALVTAFSGVLSDIVEGFRDALNLLMDIENADLPTTDELADFLAALNTLFDAVVNNFEGVSSDLLAAGYDIQQTLGTIFTSLNPDMWQAGLQTGVHFVGGLRQAMTSVAIITPLLNAMIDLANQLEDVLRAAWGISSPSKVAQRIGGYFVTGLQRGLEDLYDIPDMMNDALGAPMFGGNVTIEPAPQRAYLTVQFTGGYQSGMSPAEEQRITTAMLRELRRQGVALATR